MGDVGNKGNLMVLFGTDFTDDTVFLFVVALKFRHLNC